VQNYCVSNGWQVGKIVKEIASGVNDDRPKLNALLTDPKVTRIVAEHKDRLTRAGYKYIHQLLVMQGREVIVINLADTDNDDLLADLASIVYSYCARLYGIRRARHKADLVEKVLQDG
jgi:putative resolvase